MSKAEQMSRRRWPWIALGLALIALIPITWMSAHRLSSRTVPDAPWRESELPSIPSAADNGLDDVVLSASWSVGLPDSELSALSAPLDEETPTARWASIEATQHPMHEWLHTDEAQRGRELAQIDAALAAPRFADPCQFIDTACRMIEPIRLLRLATIADFDAALRGDWSSAFARGLALLIASKDLLATARTALSNTVALMFARISTDHLRVLIAGYAAESAGGAPRTELSALRPTLDALDVALTGLTRESGSARRAVIGECLYTRDGLLRSLENPASLGGNGGVLLPYMVDVRGSLVASDGRFVELMRWVDAPDHATRPPPSFSPYAEGTGWWLWNPGGKVMLDLLTIDLSDVLRKIDRYADALEVSRAGLRSELHTLR